MFKWLIVVTSLLAVSAYSPFGNQQGWRQGGGGNYGHHHGGWHGGPSGPGDGPSSGDGFHYPNDYSGGQGNFDDRANRFGGGGSAGTQELQGGRNTNAFEAVFQWRVIDYEYPTREDRKRAIDTKQFVPENNVPLGIAATANRVFLTTPRWTVGVPFSLSSVSLPAIRPDTPLRPYPNWSAHSTTNNVDCTKMMSVYRVHVDECNRLWAIDAGLIDTVTNAKRLCPPKLLVFDLATDKQLFQYVFPEAQVKQDSLYTNVVVEIHKGQCDKAVAYVADVWRNQLLVYDMGKQASWLTANYLYNSNPHASNFTYQGFNFQWSDGIFGLALSKATENADDRVLYFHPMSSLNEFVVKTSILRNQNAWETGSAPRTAFSNIGTRGRNGHSSTSDIDNEGVQYFTLVQKEGIGCWDTHKPYHRSNIAVLERNNVTMGFPNDLKLDGNKENIWVVSNNLPVYLYSELDYSQVNFRLMRANVNKIKGTICDPQRPASKDNFDQCTY